MFKIRMSTSAWCRDLKGRHLRSPMCHCPSQLKKMAQQTACAHLLPTWIPPLDSNASITQSNSSSDSTGWETNPSGPEPGSLSSSLSTSVKCTLGGFLPKIGDNTTCRTLRLGFFGESTARETPVDWGHQQTSIGDPFRHSNLQLTICCTWASQMNVGCCGGAGNFGLHTGDLMEPARGHCSEHARSESTTLHAHLPSTILCAA